jgi:hypothetical protein
MAMGFLAIMSAPEAWDILWSRLIYCHLPSALYLGGRLLETACGASQKEKGGSAQQKVLDDDAEPASARQIASPVTGVSQRMISAG